MAASDGSLSSYLNTGHLAKAWRKNMNNVGLSDRGPAAQAAQAQPLPSLLVTKYEYFCPHRPTSPSAKHHPTEANFDQRAD
eukprot:CAMPEP_0177439268 /NCGR_PEP_ID=MMETSP0369-20130122/3218_1 /TAXON_ID=447022 ORGANISM="Scrippsiella hangoei-like, Strain SHHI-4" /NCGR_SAMPLE_ID=MMETSP0369 /ASSEMBLY_ACC=CAM_ASM_000364 /LENGTH=80 /DNA_ID=CAMNT_0018910931 /DNA_START=27 /DNA_END=270 /DNA_ORIENTATION=-